MESQIKANMNELLRSYSTSPSSGTVQVLRHLL